MHRDERLVADFQALYERAHGEPIGSDEARVVVHRLLRLYRVLLRRRQNLRANFERSGSKEGSRVTGS
jgi:hypothetical protein